MPLTEMACRNAKPSTRSYKLFDSGGLYLEVSQNGSRHWRMKYRIFDKEKRLSFGVYPAVTLLEARQKREEAKTLLRDQIDPGVIKKEERRLATLKAAQTFELVAREWHERKSKEISKNYADDILHRLKKDVFTQIGTYPIHKVTAPVLYTCVKRIEDRGAKDMARRALQYCGQIMRYAVVTGRAERDFTGDMKGVLRKREPGHFASIKVHQLPDLVKAIDRNDARLYQQTKLALILLMLTFVRTNELIAATWDEIDFENSQWVIPAIRMKMRRPHIVPLSRQSLAILHELKNKRTRLGLIAQEVGPDYIFPSITARGKHMSNGTILKALDNLGYKGMMTGHGFRSLAMSAIKEKLRYRHEVVDRQLAHAPKNKVDKAYDRAEFLSERKKMMQRWADYVYSFITNNDF